MLSRKPCWCAIDLTDRYVERASICMRVWRWSSSSEMRVAGSIECLRNWEQRKRKEARTLRGCKIATYHFTSRALPACIANIS